MELLMLRAGIREEERTTIARFQSGLNLEIRDKVELLPYRDLNELVQLCVRVEQQFRRKPSFRKETTPYPKKDSKKEGHSSYSKDRPLEKEKSKKKPSDEPITSSIKCFKCLGKGHIAFQCPTRKIMIIRGNEILSEGNTSSSSSLLKGYLPTNPMIKTNQKERTFSILDAKFLRKLVLSLLLVDLVITLCSYRRSVVGRTICWVRLVSLFHWVRLLFQGGVVPTKETLMLKLMFMDV
uniref:CCHC-type domain-containing protein n=1 Tax=Cajanus cajan TaxID=3821 RepID=A0A151QUY0_CAJCA|nr:hypothetical protein KK1_044926 [Cajanus cajan]